jgi:uncharacterized protein YPO0396
LRHPDATPAEARATFFPALAGMQGDGALTIESCDKREKELRDEIQGRLDAHARTTQRLRDAIISAMRDYITAWPMDTRDADATIDAAGEFRRMLEALQADDLPRFAARFKELLNENTIREIAGFQSQLKRERETIRERIATINGSLQAIDYNPNRYIALEAEANLDADLRDFQQDLRSSTEGALTGSIVTPLQKIHIIEPYVAGLGFVHSEEGRQSMLRYLTIGQYQAERDARKP